MRIATVLAAAAAVLLLILRPGTVANSLAPYLNATPMPEQGKPPRRSTARLRDAGLAWSPIALTVRRVWAAAAGTVVGMLVANGDLVVAPPRGTMAGMIVTGAAAGVLGLNSWVSTRRQRRIDRLQRELPTVADALALEILSGESIGTAIEGFIQSARGVAVDELRRVNSAYRSGTALPVALAKAASETPQADAARLYTLLATAHDTGGRLADALGDLATDFRATLERSLTAEGGRRALATYAPILALMIPVTLLFLMYPTLAGLRDLAAGP